MVDQYNQSTLILIIFLGKILVESNISLTSLTQKTYMAISFSSHGQRKQCHLILSGLLLAHFLMKFKSILYII